MNKKTALTILCGVMLLLLVAATASARDRALLDQAVNASIHERAEIESRYQQNSSVQRHDEVYGDNAGVRAIELEIGDEFGTAAADDPESKPKTKEHELHQKFVGKELKREWKDVNRSFKQASARAAQRAAEEAVAEQKANIGISASSILPSSRSRRSAPASGNE